MDLDNVIREYITQFISDEELQEIPNQLIDQIYLLQRILSLNPKFSLLPILREETHRRKYQEWLRIQFEPEVLTIVQFIHSLFGDAHVDGDNFIIEVDNIDDVTELKSMLHERGIQFDEGEYSSHGNRIYEVIVNDPIWTPKIRNAYVSYRTYDQWLNREN